MFTRLIERMTLVNRKVFLFYTKRLNSRDRQILRAQKIKKTFLSEFELLVPSEAKKNDSTASAMQPTKIERTGNKSLSIARAHNHISLHWLVRATNDVHAASCHEVI